MDQQNVSLKNKAGLTLGHVGVGGYEQRKTEKVLLVAKRSGVTELFSVNRIRTTLAWACEGYEEVVSVDVIISELLKNIFDGISSDELYQALVLTASSFIELDPAYGIVASRLLRARLYKQIVGMSVLKSTYDTVYRHSFIENIKKGVSAGLFDTRFLEFDLESLSNKLDLSRDENIGFMGMKTLYDRYFLQHDGVPIELPQSFWMRIAMGLALEEDSKNQRAIEFYNAMSSLNYVPSTPTLLHSGLVRAQLSSCFLTTVSDDLHHIFKCVGDDAQLSKWSGGVANDWTNIRATGAKIKSIRIESQGVIPFLKIVNDVTAAISRSGRRRGAIVVYLETWHLDIEDFLDLRRNTGDERRRTHDINTANWIPDLFMKRVIADEKWTLFSPEETPELHNLYGKAFDEKYVEYEGKAERGELQKSKVVEAKKLWRKMLSRLFETGHPWITFKDPSNIRSPQDHAGVVNSSNLCTEITLNSSEEESAVCNLGSINLSEHVVDGAVDYDKLARSVGVAIRMLDNVIDINFYPTPETKTANMRHRPIGLGVMGFQDALYKLNVPFDSPQAEILADRLQEFISYHAIYASSRLAKERGAYSSFKGSKWDRNMFPVDTIALLESERSEAVKVSRTESMDWTDVREHVRQYGMRNSNTMAIAPTATISTISGCFPSIEPIYKNLYVKANMSGEFTVVNKYLVLDLKKLGLWNREMLEQLKYFDGSVQNIARIPDDIKAKYKEAFELDPLWLLQLTAARSKWIDQSQSHNVFMKGVSGKKLHDIYVAAWKAGLKTTYYLRTMGASQIEKSTLDAKKYGYTQKRTYTAGPSVADESGNDLSTTTEIPATDVNVCNILDPGCESCQ